MAKRGHTVYDDTSLTEVEIIHHVPLLTETNDLGGEIRRAKAEAEEKEKQERLVRDELEKKRKYEEDLRNRTTRGDTSQIVYILTNRSSHRKFRK